MTKAQVYLRRQILSPLTVACRCCRQTVWFEEDSCPSCGRSLSAVKRWEFRRLVAAHTQTLPVTCPEGVTKLMWRLRRYMGKVSGDALIVPDCATVIDVMARLPWLEAEVLKRRCGTDGAGVRTHRSVAAELVVHEAQVYHLEAGALQMLSYPTLYRRLVK